MSKEKKCKHQIADSIIPHAYFTFSLSENDVNYIPYMILLCCECDEYLIEKGMPMVKDEA